MNRLRRSRCRAATSANDGRAARVRPISAAPASVVSVGGTPSGWNGPGSSLSIRPTQMSSAKTRWRIVSTNDHSSSTRSFSSGSGTVAACATASSHIPSTTAQAARTSSAERISRTSTRSGWRRSSSAAHVARHVDVVDDHAAHALVTGQVDLVDHRGHDAQAAARRSRAP